MDRFPSRGTVEVVIDWRETGLMLLAVGGGLNLAALLAAHALRRAGRSPARFVGFAWAMVLSAVVLGAWTVFLLHQAVALEGVRPGDRVRHLAEGIAAASQMSLVTLIVPVGLLLATAVLAVVRRPPLPTARVVAGA